MSSETEDDTANLKIRIGENVAEIDKILPLAKQMHKESIFSDFPFDEDQYRRICMFIKDRPSHHGALYVEMENEPVAFAYYNLRPFMGSRKTMVTYMHTAYIRSDLRSTTLGGYIWERIMLTARGWSVPRQSRGIVFNVISGIAIEETDVVLRTSGATHLGGNYFLRI
ncbi:MAG: hypothetical protein AB8B71_17585 [Paracoccaceae bacterium]